MAEVKRSVPRDRLLVYSVEEGWEPLCKFLDVPVPAQHVPFPRSNDSKFFKFYLSMVVVGSHLVVIGLPAAFAVLLSMWALLDMVGQYL